MSSKREKREEEIKKQARQILDKFARALEKVAEIPDSFVEGEEDRRKELEGSEPDKGFQKIFFENAPATKKQCLQAERGKWK